MWLTFFFLFLEKLLVICPDFNQEERKLERTPDSSELTLAKNLKLSDGCRPVVYEVRRIRTLGRV
jgi:hypothetical protein